MNSVIYNPSEEYDSRLRALHLENTNKYFDELVARSGVDAEANRATVKQYVEHKEKLSKLKRKLTLWKVLRVIMCITLILIPLVILKITPKIKGLREEVELADKKADELFETARAQMAPLNSLFADTDALRLIERTIPLISFAPSFTAEQESNMVKNYDFKDKTNNEQSTVDLLAGSYNENPFLFERRLMHRMGTETYHGYKTIHWTETYRDSDGKTQTRMRSETLHAMVTKPKPFYDTEVVLNYCSQGAPELSFTRDATYLDRKSDKAIERYVKKGERKLKRLTDEAIKENRDFVSMSNTDFEVLFDALDRTDEVQFRTLFTPLAQTNMVDLIRSQTGYGDDFNFVKKNRTNRITTSHSQGRAVNLLPTQYFSHSFDEIKSNFIKKNESFFKAVYFDFAPLWAIPAYQERPVHSLDPIPDMAQHYSCKECEALANMVASEMVTHPATRTKAILKSAFVKPKGEADEILITAYSYDIKMRIDLIPVHGGDGRWHSVPVEWDEYLPLESSKRFFVAESEKAQGESVAAKRNGLCIYN